MADGKIRSVLFWGAGATASLKMATTEKQSNIFYALCNKDREDSYKTCLDEFKDDFHSGFEALCDLLTLLDDTSGKFECGYRMSGFSEEQLKLIEKYKNDLGGDIEKCKNRLIMMRMRYDWAAVMRILRANKHNQEWDSGSQRFKPSSTFTQKIYSFIDANVSAGTGVHIFDEEEKGLSNFLDAQRLRGAKAAMILFINICFTLAWHKSRKSKEIQNYKEIFKWLAQLRAKESEDVFSTSIVSMNFDPLFWWFSKNADAEYNKSPIYSSDQGEPIFLGEDVDCVDGVRELTKSKSNTPADEILPESIVHFVNKRGLLENEKCIAQYKTIKIFFPHGSPNLKICPCCGKTTLFQGDELSWDSETLFPPFCFSKFNGPNEPASEVSEETGMFSEKENWNAGEKDYIQCRHCGRGIRMCDTEMLMQSEIKTRPSWILQRIAHNIDLEIMRANHIILLGYSLPPDDALWFAELQARTQRTEEKVYCSIVGYEENKSKNGWITGRELESLVKDSEASQFRVVKNAIKIFDTENVRVNFGGFPNVITNKDFLQDLLYPKKWIQREEVWYE